MPISTHIDSQTGVRTHTVRGTLDFGDLRATLDEVYARPDASETGAVWDLRAADIHAFTPEQVNAIVKRVKEHWQGSERGTVRSAIVVAGDFDFGMARMYELRLDAPSNLAVQVFRELDEAVAWVTRTPDA
jgi:hypothetical protein